METLINDQPNNLGLNVNAELAEKFDNLLNNDVALAAHKASMIGCLNDRL